MMEHSILLVVFTAFLFHVDGILGNSCPSTAATVRIVDKCPKTEQAWKEAAARKRCPMLGQTQYCSNFQYHCLVNQWQNATLEVCAPTWYISGFCTMFNTDENRVIDNFRLDCTNFTEPCPTRYISTDAYKYQQCYMHRLVNKNVNGTPQRFKEKEHVTPTLHSSDTPWKIVAGVFISLFTILLFVGTLLLVKYARQSRLEADGVERASTESGVGDPNTSAHIESSNETDPLMEKNNQENGDIGVDGNQPLVNRSTDFKKAQKSGDIGVAVNRLRGNNTEIQTGKEQSTVVVNTDQRTHIDHELVELEKLGCVRGSAGKNSSFVTSEKFDNQPGSEKKEKTNENSNNDGKIDEDEEIATEATEDSAGHNGSGMLNNSCDKSERIQVQEESGDTCNNKTADIDIDGIPIQETGQNGSAMESSPLKSDNDGHGDLQNSITEEHVENVPTNANNTDEAPRSGYSNKTT